MGMINQSYATGTVSGDANIGGLVGYSNEGSLNRSYATGTVSGTTNLGGIVGNGYLYSIDGSYWDVGTTGQTNATGTSTGTTSTLIGFGDVTDTGPAPEMQRFAPAATMTAFDFESTWNLTSSYPRLSWEGATPITVDSLTASNQTITAGNSGTITVTATESGGDAGEGVTIEVIANDSLGGLLNGTMTVTNADGTATFSFTENTASTYGVTLAWVDDSTVNASPVVTVASRPSNNNGGGGGGSGGGSPDAADVAVSTEPGDDETTGSTVTVTGAKAGQPVAVVREDGEPLAQGDDSSVDGLSVTTNTDRDFSVSVRSHEDLDENNPEGAIALSRETDGADPIEYMTIDHDLDDEEITEASITFSVTEDDLEGPPSGVTLFRNVDGAWVPLETSLVRETDAGAQYEAITPGFSVFAIGGNDPPDDEQSTDSPPDESTAESRTDDEAPGFGLLVGLVSVLAVALMLRRRTRHRM
jgi:PGF-CTERM protein